MVVATSENENAAAAASTNSGEETIFVRAAPHHII